MKKLLPVVILSFLCHSILAQFDDTIPPHSSTLNPILFSKLDEVVLPAFSGVVAANLDLSDSKAGRAPKFARSIAVDFNLSNSGEWMDLPDGGSVWRLRITSKGALGLVPVFKELYLPEGATLHVYMPDGEEVIGAFTHSNTREPRGFCTGIIHGESCVFEYFEPAKHKGEGILQLESIGHAYRWVQPLKLNDASRDASDTCEVNVNCEEGTLWQKEKKAVARILVVDNLGEAYCSGSLINNARNDCDPYFLSAQHCSEGVTNGNFSQWVFYFNYESNSCNGASGPQNQTINGCTKVADSNDNGGDNGSDFLLLRLASSIPNSFNAYFPGWDRSQDIPDSCVTIHHPNGDIKKISTSISPSSIISWGEIVPNTHFEVTWGETLNGHGITEPGSSGAPLFDKYGRIIGTLTGGDSYCQFPYDPDAFGRFYFDWQSNGPNNVNQLKPWLDPEDIGVIAIDGRFNDCLVGIAEKPSSENSFEVFPNPSNGLLNLYFNSANSRNVRIFDVAGRMISQGTDSRQTFQLNLSSFNRGVYWIQAEDGEEVQFKKIILN